MSQDRTQILREHKVIPDVLPEGTTLSHDLKVVFPEATLDTPGQELGREETQPEPRLFLDPVVRPHSSCEIYRSSAKPSIATREAQRLRPHPHRPGTYHSHPSTPLATCTNLLTPPP